jgi:hypothetical protein
VQGKKIAREHKNVLGEMDFELLPNVFFVSLYKIFLKYTINYTKLYKKVIYYKFFVLVMGRVVVGRVVRGVSFDGASCPWGELSMG